MTTVTSHPPGSFCWIELGTSDANAAKQFYTGLFGWTVVDYSMGEMGTYSIFQKDGKDAAAVYQIGPQQAGMPPNWLSYISVASADDATEKAKSLGANVMSGPFDAGEYGRMSVIIDPQGAMFAIWEGKQNPGVGVRDEANSLCWNELQARGLDAARQFYPAMFGWTMKDSPEYTEWQMGDRSIGGMMQSQAPESVPPYWMPYIAVDDCDAVVDKAKAGGAQVFAGPMNYPGVGRFAIMADPQGAVLAVIRLDMGTHT